MSQHPELVEHLRRHSVRTDGPFTLRSGEISDFYIDARQTTFDGKGATLVDRSGGKAAGRLSILGIELVALCTLEDLGL